LFILVLALAACAPPPLSELAEPTALPRAATLPTTTPAAVDTPVAAPPTAPAAAPTSQDQPEAEEDAPPSLETFWDRLRTLQFAPALRNLQPLPGSDRDDPLFGINAALAADDASAPIMRGVGADLDRLELRWDVLEPSSGDFQFDHLDDLLTTAKRLGL